MSLALQALWLLAGIGAVVFSTGAAVPRRVAGVAVGFGLSAWLLWDGVPDAATVAGFAALVAGFKLYRPGWVTLPAFCGGLLAAVLGALLAADGVPNWIAWFCAAIVPLVSIALASRNSNFAPESVQEEGMLLMLALGLGAAVGPALVDGWRSAGAMNIAGETANNAFPAWVISAAGASTLIGGAWSLWRHR
ncbi:MAG: hypothetical protein ABIR70_05020 [Bryobacteraceae bacterium]